MILLVFTYFEVVVIVLGLSFLIFDEFLTFWEFWVLKNDQNLSPRRGATQGSGEFKHSLDKFRPSLNMFKHGLNMFKHSFRQVLAIFQHSKISKSQKLIKNKKTKAQDYYPDPQVGKD